jgi:hypothetical protein
VKPSIIVACLTLGTAAALGACSNAGPGCSVTFRGGCVPNTASSTAEIPAAATPAVTGPAGAAPAVISPAAATPAGTSPAAMRLGDPSEFAVVDDKQCRSYGLAFGSRDYADCRIRLSAQHRGLDPNVGPTH